MDELVELVAEKTGLPEEMAKIAVETVIGYLKGKLPGPVAGQIDNLLGGAGGGQDLGGVAKGLGGLFGKK
jgi:septal ring factor EnvC (AmiA/AmiB activator)